MCGILRQIKKKWLKIYLVLIPMYYNIVIYKYIYILWNAVTGVNSFSSECSGKIKLSNAVLFV